MEGASMELGALAHHVLLPATAGCELTPVLGDLLRRGCRSILLGETREEYVAREMTPERVRSESRAGVRGFVERAREAAGGGVVIAADCEVGGIERFRAFAPLPEPAEAVAMSSAALADRVAQAGADLRDLGVNLALGPVVDVVCGPNPWLERRNLGPDHIVVGRVGAAVVEGLRRAGVAAAVKHFPGHPTLPGDPAVDEAVESTVSLDELRERDLPPFKAAIDAGARVVMLGPAVIPALDPLRAASLSPRVIELLRGECGFGGVIVTDDLDARSILGDRTLGAAACAALAAGADLLLVAAEGAAECAAAIVEAVERDDVPRERLAKAVDRVRQLVPA
jgi:beta-N-acetylhexosaminidase